MHVTVICMHPTAKMYLAIPPKCPQCFACPILRMYTQRSRCEDCCSSNQCNITTRLSTHSMKVPSTARYALWDIPNADRLLQLLMPLLLVHWGTQFVGILCSIIEKFTCKESAAFGRLKCIQLARPTCVDGTQQAISFGQFCVQPKSNGERGAPKNPMRPI